MSINFSMDQLHRLIKYVLVVLESFELFCYTSERDGLYEERSLIEQQFKELKPLIERAVFFVMSESAMESSFLFSLGVIFLSYYLSLTTKYGEESLPLQ